MRIIRLSVLHENGKLETFTEGKADVVSIRMDPDRTGFWVDFGWFELFYAIDTALHVETKHGAAHD